MAAREKRSITSSLTGLQGRSRRTTIRFKRVLVKSIYQVASRRDGEARPESKREAGCEVIGRV